jgi:hypothetical protein
MSLHLIPRALRPSVKVSSALFAIGSKRRSLKMNIVEKIIEKLKSLPESDQAEVLDFLEYLKSKKEGKYEDPEWSRFSLDSAMRGIEEEPSPYGFEDIKEQF